MSGKALPMFTISTFNQNKFQPAGAVFAQRVETVGGAPKGGLFSSSSSKSEAGRNPAMEKNMDNLTRALKEQLVVNTLAVFPSAKALVDLKITFSNIGTNDTIHLAGQATATALVNRPPKTAPNSMSPPVVKPLEMEGPGMPQFSEDPQGLSGSRPFNGSGPLSGPGPGPEMLSGPAPLSGPRPFNGPAAGPGPLSGPRPMFGGRRNKSNKRRTAKHRK